MMLPNFIIQNMKLGRIIFCLHCQVPPMFSAVYLDKLCGKLQLFFTYKKFCNRSVLTLFVPGKGGEFASPPFSHFNIAPKRKTNFCFDAPWLWIKFNNTHFQKLWGQPENRKWLHFCLCQRHLRSFMQFWAQCKLISAHILFIVLRIYC